MRQLSFMFMLFIHGFASAQQNQPSGAKPEQAPTPRSLPGLVAPGGWTANEATGEWTDIEGTKWKFDGLRWRVLWIDQKWYPVIPPGPIPLDWRREDLGQGWSEVLPPNLTSWHIIPPAPALLPPPFFLAPDVWGPGAGPSRPQRLFTRRWR